MIRKTRLISFLYPSLVVFTTAYRKRTERSHAGSYSIMVVILSFTVFDDYITVKFKSGIEVNVHA